MNELALLTGLTRRLPPIRGSKRFAYILSRLYARKLREPVLADVHGSLLRLSPHEYVDMNLLFCPQLYDRWEFNILRKHVKPGDVVFDVGSHIGAYALFLAQQIGPTGTVYAFEASPDNFDYLRQNIERNKIKNIIAQNLAVSDSSGQVTLYLDQTGNAGGNSLLPLPQARSLVVDAVTLETVTRNVPRIDFMKIDIENLEYRVLAHFFSRAPMSKFPGRILTEHHPSGVTTAGGDLLLLLRQNGYKQIAETLRGVPNFLFSRT